MRIVTVHDLHPGIPLGTPMDLLVHSERARQMAFARKKLDAGTRLDPYIYQDRMKGSPAELLRLELQIAERVFIEETALGAGRPEVLLTPRHGWTLPELTRQAVQHWDNFTLRILASTTAEDRGPQIYYISGDPHNPRVPGEVADYLGIPPGQTHALNITGHPDARVSLRREESGEAQLVGFGSHLAQHGTYRGEVTLRFTRDKTLDWRLNGFWKGQAVQV